MDKDHHEPIDLGLLKDFPPPTREEWMKAVEDTLKGVPYEKAMITKTYEGIDLKPIYTKADLEGLAHLSDLPGQAPFVRGNTPEGYLTSGWKIAQEQNEHECEAANRIILDELNRGLTTVNLRLNSATSSGINPMEGDCSETGIVLSTLEDFTTLMKDVDLSAVPLMIKSKEASLLFIGLVNAYFKQQDMPLAKLTGLIGFDPLTELVSAGELVISMEDTWRSMYQSVYWADLKAKHLRTVLLDGATWGNFGANGVQELAYSLTSAITYIDMLMEKGLTIEQIAPQFQLNLNLGSNFFMEIAKVRAARLLWAELMKAYGAPEEYRKIWIHGVTSEFNKTVFDPYVNMLRTTTEAFSGVIGGVDSLEVVPFDIKVRENDEFSRRIARNQQIILQEEVHLDRVIDPAGGCYYIESITAEIAKAVWEKVQYVESEGGMIECLKNNMVQADIGVIALERMTNVDKRKDVVVGINMFANPIEQPLEQPEHRCNCQLISEAEKYAELDKRNNKGLEKSLDYIKENPTNNYMVDMLTDAWLHEATIEDVFYVLYPDDPDLEIANIFRARATMAIEGVRKSVINYQQENETVLSVFLANMGPISQHKARADFAMGFLQVGGFYVGANDGFDNVKHAADAALLSRAQICCICSTDDTYPEIVPDFIAKVRAVKPDMIFVLAGYPTEMVETYKQQGVDFFIHLRANVFEVLMDIAKKLGVMK